MTVNKIFFEPTALRLTECFNRAFSLTENTVLEGRASKPYYRPGSPNVIYFREDLSRSALHEVAHWCVAGAARRGLPDYGYWYAPDGRDEAQQVAFYGVEVRPQAIEKIFCEALGIDFKVSVDNLSVSHSDPAIASFTAAVKGEFDRLSRCGLPERAELFRRALTQCI